jgi:hypothetical protein
MTAQNFMNSTAKIGSKGKLEKGISGITLKLKLFIGTYITFLKGYDADYPINPKLSMNYSSGSQTFLTRGTKKSLKFCRGTIPSEI